MTRPLSHDGEPSPDEHLAMAAEALDERDFPHAALSLACALAADPRRPEALALVDRLRKEAPDPLAAIEIDGPFPPYFGSVALRGLLCHRLGRSAEGARLLLDVLCDYPQHVAYLPWALEAIEVPGVPEALTDADALQYLVNLFYSPAGQQKRPDSRELLQSFAPLVRAFFRAYPSAPQVHLCGSYLLRRAGLTEEALAAARRVDALSPSAVSADACATALSDAGRVEEALEMLRLGLRREPESVDVRLDYADTLLNAGRIEEARHEFGTVFDRVPDHPWAPPQMLYFRYLLSHDGRALDELRRFAAAYPENRRASYLLARCSPYERGLPGPSEAILNVVEQAGARARELVSLSATHLEAPSVHLCLRVLLGKDVRISVPESRAPDATRPRGPVKHLLWVYDTDLHPTPRGSAPSDDVLRAVGAVAGRPYEREAWWAAAQDVAARLGPDSIGEILGSMVHPSPAPDGVRVAAWIHAWQFAAAFVAVQVSWKDLTDIARGPMDWTVEAAVVALARRAMEDASARPDVLKLFEELATSMPRPGPVSYEYALYCVLPWVPDAPPRLTELAARGRTEVEAGREMPPPTPSDAPAGTA